MRIIYTEAMMYYNQAMEEFKQSPVETAEEKQKKWEEMMSKVNRMEDAVGGGMDNNIKECVAALNLLGFVTQQSCGGHLPEEGEYNEARLPWISLTVEDEPIEWVGELDLRKRLMDKHGFKSDREIFKNDEAYQEYDGELCKFDERTDEWKEWHKTRFIPSMEKADELIRRYNEKTGKKFVFNGRILYDMTTKDLGEFNKLDPETARQEFDELTEYLKEKFFSM